MITHKIDVELLNVMGTDLDIVNAARASFDKQSDWDYIEVEEPFNPVPIKIPVLKERDEKLIRYLAKNNHWTPFGQANAQFRFYVPIFVARQLMRHNVGVVWNERSRRYVSSNTEYYLPYIWRKKPEGSIKQGSGEQEFLTQELEQEVVELIHSADRLYEKLIDNDYAPELARIILPQNLMTSIVGNGTLYFWARFCKLRLDNNAQEEIRTVAESIDEALGEHFPCAWEALREFYINNDKADEN